jgi:hypothetical protein
MPDDTVPKDVFVDARLSGLAYLKFEHDPRARAELEAGAHRLGFDRVAYFSRGPGDAKACIFYNTKERHAVVAFRGTDGDESMKTNLDIRPKTRPEAYGDVWVHSGYDRAVDSIYEGLHESLARFQAECPGATVGVTGHSQGGGHSQLFAARAKADGINVTSVTLCEAPPVADHDELTKLYKKLGIRDVTKIEEKNSLVTQLPSNLLLQKPRLSWTPYTTAIGARDPDHPGAPSVGRYLYIDSNDQIHVNPRADEVKRDREKVTWHKPLDFVNVVELNEHELPRPGIGHSFRHHFGFDRILFRHTSAEYQKEWQDKLAHERVDAEKDLLARPSSAPDGLSDASWNSIRREQRSLEDPPRVHTPLDDVMSHTRIPAVPPREVGHLMPEQDWQWASHHDCRNHFAFSTQRDPRPARSGRWSETVTAHGTVAFPPDQTINWETALATPPESPSAGPRAAQGRLVDARFGVSASEHLNRTPPIEGKAWSEIISQISRSAADQKQAPLSLTVSRRCEVGREGDRTYYPPTVTVKDRHGLPVKAELFLGARHVNDVPMKTTVDLDGFQVPGAVTRIAPEIPGRGPSVERATPPEPDAHAPRPEAPAQARVSPRRSH